MSVEKQKNKQSQMLDDLYMEYKNRNYNMNKIEKIENIFESSPLILTERGVINYFDDKDRYENSRQDRDWLYLNRIDKIVNDAINLNQDKDPSENSNLDNLLTKKEEKDLEDKIPTKEIYKKMIKNELYNYEIKENLNELIATEEDRINAEETIFSTKYSKNMFEIKSKNDEKINIKESFPIDSNSSPINKLSNYSNLISPSSVNNNILMSPNSPMRKNPKNKMDLYSNSNLNSNFKDLNETNKLSQISNSNRKEIKKTNVSKILQTNDIRESKVNKNWLKKNTNAKNILQKNGDTITNRFHATNSTLDDDFKVMRKSGMIIDSSFIKTKNQGIFSKNYSKVEVLFDKTVNNVIRTEEILDHFKENDRNVSYNEKIKVQPSEVLRHIRDVDKRVEKIDVQKTFTPLIERLADSRIGVDILDDIKRLDKQLKSVDMDFYLKLNMNKN